MKKRKVLAVLLCAAMTAALAVGCGGSKGSDSSDKSSDSSSSSDDVITVGFSQVGAESDWRTANSNSTKTNAFCLGIILCNVSRSFDYLIYPYYPAYTS